MSEATCPYCSSTRVTIVESYETRDVMVIQCLKCGKRSALDTENDQTRIGTVAPADNDDR